MIHDRLRVVLRLVLVVGLSAGCATGTAATDVFRDDADVSGDEGGDGEETDGEEAVEEEAADGDAVSVCTMDSQCDDGIVCTVDRCDAGRCVNEPQDSACDDGNACTRGERCDPAFGCLPGSLVDCTDGIDCTRDECSPLTGDCVNAPDHRRCVEPEFCYPAAGGCAPAPPCVSDADCEDGDLCNGSERCSPAATCERGTPVDCGDDIDCTRDSCDPATGACSHYAEDGRCDNLDLCDGLETCDELEGCVGGTAVDCADGVPCTDDLCAPATAECSHRPNDARCSDGVFCNGAERCDAAAGCVGGTPATCDDGVGCTEDRCDTGTDRCANVPRDAACDDGQSCNGRETCSASGDCLPGTAPACDDGLVCTIDRCDPAAAAGAGACTAASPDVDSDGHGDAACTGDDCDDGNGGVHPGATEACNALDDNCDTTVDEGYTCVRGQVEACTTGPCTGARTCGASCTWGACVVSATETCNGVDDTCNGLADETFDCVLGATRPCSVGTCAGLQRCSATCTWGACAVSAVESCNGIDDDCDGTTDEGFSCPAGQTRACAVGACTGTQTCSASCAWGDCVLGADSCDGVDNDCDGATDEDFACRMGQTRACSNSCGVAGTETCASGTCTWGACCASAEDCANTCDDDCDTVVNDGCCTVGDGCACPAPVRAGGGRHTGTTVGMTDDFSTSCGGSGSPDVVYVLTLTETQHLLIDTNGSSFDTVLSLWSGTSCPGTLLTCDDDSGEGARSFFQRTVGAGTYYIVVDGYDAADAGSYNLNVAIGSGDSCTAPRQLGGPGIYSGSTCGYNHNFSATSCAGGALGVDIVYRLVLAEAHTVVFDMCRGSTAFDTVLYVRSNNCTTGTQLGCNDDSTTCPASLSYLSLPLAAGTYYVYVDGYSGGCGLYELGVSYE